MKKFVIFGSFMMCFPLLKLQDDGLSDFHRSMQVFLVTVIKDYF